MIRVFNPGGEAFRGGLNCVPSSSGTRYAYSPTPPNPRIPILFEPVLARILIKESLQGAQRRGNLSIEEDSLSKRLPRRPSGSSQ
jgi:hypothetical protein